MAGSSPNLLREEIGNQIKAEALLLSLRLWRLALMWSPQRRSGGGGRWKTAPPAHHHGDALNEHLLENSRGGAENTPENPKTGESKTGSPRFRCRFSVFQPGLPDFGFWFLSFRVSEPGGVVALADGWEPALAAHHHSRGGSPENPRTGKTETGCRKTGNPGVVVLGFGFLGFGCPGDQVMIIGRSGGRAQAPPAHHHSRGGAHHNLITIVISCYNMESRHPKPGT